MTNAHATIVPDGAIAHKLYRTAPRIFVGQTRVECHIVHGNASDR
jgi:hypothetical protein